MRRNSQSKVIFAYFVGNKLKLTTFDELKQKLKLQRLKKMPESGTINEADELFQMVVSMYFK